MKPVVLAAITANTVAPGATIVTTATRVAVVVRRRTSMPAESVPTII